MPGKSKESVDIWKLDEWEDKHLEMAAGHADYDKSIPRVCDALGKIITDFDDQARLERQGKLKRQGELLKEGLKLLVDYIGRVSHALGSEWIRTPGEYNQLFDIGNVKEEGKSNAMDRIPRPRYDTVGDVKTFVEDFITEQYQREFTFFCEAINQILDALDGLLGKMKQRLRDRKIRIEQEASEKSKSVESNYYDLSYATQKIRDFATSYKGLKNKLEACINSYQARENFLKAQNVGVNSRPKYETSWYAFGLVAFLCVLGETAVNSFMYAQASDLGWVGGVGVALGLSASIFFLSLVAGWLLTWKNLLRVEIFSVDGKSSHWEKSIFPRIKGWVGFITCSALVLALIAIVCVYRDEAVTFDPSVSDGSVVMAETIRRVKEFDFLPKADIEGVFLFLVNLLVMFIGWWKGYHCFSSLPGYKKQDKELNDHREKLKKARDKCANLFNKARTHHFEADPAYETLREAYSDISKLSIDLSKKLEKCLDNIQRRCDKTIKAYRDSNATHRPGPRPLPKEFRKPPSSVLNTGIWDKDKHNSIVSSHEKDHYDLNVSDEIIDVHLAMARSVFKEEKEKKEHKEAFDGYNGLFSDAGSHLAVDS